MWPPARCPGGDTPSGPAHGSSAPVPRPPGFRFHPSVPGTDFTSPPPVAPSLLLFPFPFSSLPLLLHFPAGSQDLRPPDPDAFAPSCAPQISAGCPQPPAPSRGRSAQPGPIAVGDGGTVVERGGVRQHRAASPGHLPPPAGLLGFAPQTAIRVPPKLHPKCNSRPHSQRRGFRLRCPTTFPWDARTWGRRGDRGCSRSLKPRRELLLFLIHSLWAFFLPPLLPPTILISP